MRRVNGKVEKDIRRPPIELRDFRHVRCQAYEKKAA